MSEKNEWKPIDSAPKDGTPVLLFARLSGHNIQTNSRYAPTIQVGAFRTDLKIWTGSAYRDQREIEIEPISWMPLPPFPGSLDSSAPGDAKDERATRVRKVIEWATPGNVMAAPLVACEHIRGMAALVLAAPAAGDALDSKRLKWIAQNAWALRDLDNGRKNSLVWQQPRTSTEGALNRLRAAIDAALAAQVPQQGEA